ncbi:MAG: hypothetical protein ACRDPD_36685 [Streptosporangiaceae bacterium]
MAGKDTSYTHLDWRTAMTNIRDALDQVLAPGLDHIHADLRRVQAGRTQLTQAGQMTVLVGELGDEATRILGDHDQRLRKVGEAQAAAGGLAEVAGDKRYHQD